MKLIDADALKKDDEVTKWITRDAVRTGKMLKAFSELFVKKIDNAPIVNAVVIPDNATNGDVIKALFPKADIKYFPERGRGGEVLVWHTDFYYTDYMLTWWNAPYKKGGTE